MSAGELVIVGSGIQLGRDLTPRARSEIEHAEVVFCMADPFALAWIRQIRPDTANLAEYYGGNRDRRDIYTDMENAVLEPVRAGKHVCAIFYGHPGIFTDPSHAAIAAARAEGHRAVMLPGVSSEACLYADLGLDPGKRGVQSFEATYFLIREVTIEPSALLILWQVALCGDLTRTRFETTPGRLGLLVEKLGRWYPADTEVILYEAAQIPVQSFRAERVKLEKLPMASYVEHTTLVIPPDVRPGRDEGILARLEA